MRSPGNRDRTSPARHLALSRHPGGRPMWHRPRRERRQRWGCMRIPCVGAEPGKKSRRLRKVKGSPRCPNPPR